MKQLPEIGLLRLSDVIGEEEITKDQATVNIKRNKQAKVDAIKRGRVDKSGKPIYAHRPTIVRPAIAAIIPVKKSCWWEGVKSGRFPKPVKIGPRVTAWKVEDIDALIKSLK